MPGVTCCVCNSPIEGPAKTLGGRYFCDRHYAKVAHERKGIWRAALALVVGVVAFVLVVFAVAPLLRDKLSGAGLLVAGTVLALVPAVLWLSVFYIQDRVEPEPKAHLLGIFLLGALVAQGAGEPLIHEIFNVNEWAGGSLLLRLVAAIFIVGATQEFLKYAAVRYSIFRSQEFDERIDGIIYGAAAGLGYATMLNASFVVSSGGVDLGVGAIRIAVNALAHASFAGVSGYFLGRAKFEERGPFWLPIGVLAAAILNGLVTVALGEISRTGLRATPLNGLILAAAIAAATFALLFLMIRRINRAGLAAG